MSYVLIFIVLMWTPTLSVINITAEFNTLEACEKANENLRENYRGFTERNIPFNSTILTGKCYPNS